MHKIVIIGGGPAGISASLYTVRAGIDTVIITNGMGALEKAEKIENYYGFAEPVSGSELFQTGLAQAKRLGVTIVEGEAVSIEFDGRLKITLSDDSSYEADSIIFATGAPRTSPKIPGFEELDGKGISRCAVCDAFFYRKKPVAVLGNGRYAAHEAAELLPVCSSVTILTDGNEIAAEFPEGVSINTKKIAALRGDERLSGIEFTDGSTLEADGLFIAIGIAGSAEFAAKLGAVTENGKIAVDRNMATNIPGVFAAGDCTGGLYQIAKAVSDGATAGMSAVKYIRSLKK